MAMAAKRSAQAKKKAGKAPEPYVVFARRFRPQSFDDVVGQGTVTSALRRALKSGRLAQAYLLAGPRGVGKTSLARIFAKALNCLKGTHPGGVAEEPCNACEACQSIQDGHALDVIEMDAATNRGINEIRELRENVGLAPSQLRFKVYIVDEVHMLTTEAWNAFLKTLEEPPRHVKFIFATTDPDKIPETILSRCQRFDLRRIGPVEIVRRLEKICAAEHVQAEASALQRIAGLSKGGLRDAEGLLDLAVNLGEQTVSDEVVREISGAAPDELIFEVLTACAEGRTAEALAQSGQALDAGADPGDLLEAFTERLRGTLLAKTCGADSALLEAQAHLRESFAALGKKLSEDQILMLLELFSAARRNVRNAAQARLPLEMALVRAARAPELVDLGKLVSALERGASNVAVGRPGAGRTAARGAPRPNSASRPAGAVEARPAAATPRTAAPEPDAHSNRPASSARTARPAAKPSSDPAGAALPERWDELLSAVRSLNGGALIVSALSHARGVTLDPQAGTLELAFSPGQGFYRESLERPERLAALQEALTRVHGRALAVTFRRASGESESAPRVSRAPRVRPAGRAGRPVPDAGAPAEDSPEPEEVPEEEEAYHDEGALPLSGPAAAEARVGKVGAGRAGGKKNAAAARAPASGDAVPDAPDPAWNAPVRGMAVALSEVRAHPLVKAVLERMSGRVVDAARPARPVRREAP